LNTLDFDSLRLEVWGGCGTINMDIDVMNGYFYLQQGTSDIHLTGNCGIGSFFSGDFGLLNAEGMRSGYVFITSRSSNNCYVNVFQELSATIESIGDIYYTGNPGKVGITIHGSGNVIPY